MKLSALIKWYRKSFRKLAKWGRNKEEFLKRVERDPIGDEDALTLDGPRLVQFIKARRAQAPPLWGTISFGSESSSAPRKVWIASPYVQ